MSQAQESDYEKMAEEQHDVQELTRFEYIFVKFIRPGLAELFGLLLFVFIDVMAVVSTKHILGVALAHGLSLFVLVTVFAPVSGGHLNPAVTLASFICGKMTWPYLILYPIVQLIGGLLGALLAVVVKNGETSTTVKATSPTDVYVAGHMPEEGVSFWQAIIGETIITFVLVLVVLMTTDKKYKSGFAPLAIGLAVLVGVLSCGRITGGSMNPARSFGAAIASAIVGKSKPLSYLYIYFVGPLLGAVLAAVNYKLLFGHSSSRWIVKNAD